MDILILLYIIFYTILAKLRLRWAVIFLIVALPTYLIRFKVLGIPMTILEAMIFISFFIWFLDNYRIIFNNIKRKLEIRNCLSYCLRQQARQGKLEVNNRYPFDLEIILLLIISFIAVAVAGFSDSAFGIWKAYFFEPVLVFVLIINLFGKQNKGVTTANAFAPLIWPLAISAFVISVIAIYQKFTGAWIFNDFWAEESTRRVTSFFGYPNAVGLYLGPIITVLIGWMMYYINSVNKRVISYRLLVIGSGFATVILSMLAIYFAKSMGALIAMVAGLIIFALLAGRKIKWATIIILLILGIGISVYQPARDYAIKTITLKNLSGEIRKQQWRETWAMLKAGRFIAGSGLANYQEAIRPYHQEGIYYNKDNDPDFRRKIVIFDEKYKAGRWQPVEIYLYPHNIFLNFWTELGLGGLLLFVWLIGRYFVIGIYLIRNWKLEIRNSDMNNNKHLVLGLICAMIVIIVHGLVDVPYFKNDLAVMFWVLAAMMSIVKLKYQKNETL
ncbi:MAG: O-antigen ligase family protein [Patescibacteria group bacterium]